MGSLGRERPRKTDNEKMLATAAAIGALALFGAPIAQAVTNAEADYLNDLQSAGIAGDERGLLADGHTMCDALAGGVHPNDLAAAYFSNATGLSHAQADAAVNFAIKDLCPAG
jgi:hypothetical protein